MSRRRPPAGATISLFPFLAVLLCTMGALLVLLVIFSRRARDSEAAAARAQEQDLVVELELTRDELRWRLDQLQGVRERTEEDLSRERMRLAGVEEDARRLADELDALERTAEALATADPDSSVTAAVAEAERRLAASRTALEEARAAGAGKPEAYAVVPYEGTNGTHRRPLYIECCIDGVFLQPEGIRLGPGDFEGPPGPGNPLASALRAAREYLARAPDETGDPAAQPYPLLLVRPSGVMAYYAAREALTSWGSEFGYQFVDEDWPLTYPPADPALADVEKRAIEESRRRMEWLAQVRPTRPARPTQQFRAATTRGGVVAEGGATVLGDRSRFDWTEEQASTGRQSDDGGGEQDGEGAPGGGDAVLGHGARGSESTGGERYAGPSRFYSGQPPTGGAGPGPGAGGAAAAGAEQAHGTRYGPTSGGAAAGDAALGTVAGVGAAGASADGSRAGREASQGGGSGAGAGGTQGGAAPAMSASAGAGGAGGTGGPALPGMAHGAGATGSAGGPSAASGSLAGARGSNWASLATADRPVPLRRPIRVECGAHEFRVFDDAGVRPETRVPIGTRTADAVDPLVAAVHDRVRNWGLAGERMYWRPELVLSATADGQSRRADLERLLADSGLDTRRGEADTQVRLLPPVTRAGTSVPRR